MKSFHILIYDLYIKGITLSLLHTIIEQYSPNNASSVWSQVYDHVQWESEYSGYLTIDRIPSEIVSMFKKYEIRNIPNSFISHKDATVSDWNMHPNANELAIISLLGSWSELSDSDKALVSQITQNKYQDFINILRDIIQIQSSPIILKNGLWNINERKLLLETLGARILDSNLDTFKSCAIKVLSESDPRLELSTSDRFSASMFGKSFKYSHQIRNGLANTLAIISNYPDILTQCTSGKPEVIATLIVRELLSNSDWIRWASLNNLLPLFAEAAPDEFLNCVEHALNQKPSPFDEIFAQKINAMFGENHLTGLLWALENLSWEERYLVQTTVILGELARRDPGCNLANRPINSLKTIFLPWYPQTIAPVEKRKIAIRTLFNEQSEIAIKVALDMLPNSHQVSSGSHKPLWRKRIPDDFGKEIITSEYWDQVSYYTELLIENINGNEQLINSLIDNLDKLPQHDFNTFLLYLSSDSIMQKPKSDKTIIWNKLINFISRHQRHSTATWSVKGNVLDRIKEVANKIQPDDPFELYLRLFTEREIDLYETSDDWGKQRQLLDKKRQKAIKEIIVFSGFDSILKLIARVDSTSNIGNALGSIDADDIYDKDIFPKFLSCDDKKIEVLCSTYIFVKFNLKGWDWVDQTVNTKWDASQIAFFFASLPFMDATWKYLAKYPKETETHYWKTVRANPYHSNSSMEYAIEKLIEHDRPYSAIECIYTNVSDKILINNTLIVKTLLAATSTKEPINNMDSYYVVELIKVLQSSSEIIVDDMVHIEIYFHHLLDRTNDASPKFLENQLATDPDFFCNMIQMLYRSKHIPENKIIITEEQKRSAGNVWQILYNWRTPPGQSIEGNFEGDYFEDWITKIWEKTSESGHLEVALSHIGQVLIYAPADSGGLWINMKVARTLNRKDAEKLRKGFRSGIVNSRGVHWVDPSGKQERDLADKWRKNAEDVETVGYHRLASELRQLADSYDKEANIVYDHYKIDEL
jgi:hypothetical protein